MKKLLLLLASAILVLSLGCSDSAIDPSISGPQPDSDPVASEIPPDVYDLFGLPESGSGGFGDDEAPGFPDDRFAVYSVTIIWGNLSHNTMHYDRLTDWSGTLSINGAGAVLVKKTIRFEDGEDSVLTQDERHLVAWVSQTHGDVDGLHFEVYVDTTVVYIAAPMLTMETEPFTHSWHLGDLAELSAMYHLDDHNKVAIVARRMEQGHCRRGGFEGVWHFNNDRHSGLFQGVWQDLGHHYGGILKGEFWSERIDDPANPDAVARYFKGKFHDRSGAFQGEIKGSWSFVPHVACVDCDYFDGVFRGRLTNGDARGSGWIVGRFKLPPHDSNERGKMMGEWGVGCDSRGDRPHD